MQGNVAIADVNVFQAVGAGVSDYSGKIQAFTEAYCETEPGFEIPFGGRDDELRGLDVWLDQRDAPSRCLLVAPLARGKSALLVHWFERLKASGRVGDLDGQFRAVFVPISERFGTDEPAVFYEALAARLAEIVTDELEAPPLVNREAWFEDRCRRMLEQADRAGLSVLIVMDGIDEALGSTFEANWFPRASNPRLRLLLSARPLIGDVEAEGWIDRLGWRQGISVQIQRLQRLNLHGVEALLRSVGERLAPLAQSATCVRRLLELTSGEPLELRLWIDALVARDSSVADALDDLADTRPGLHGYFSFLMSRQRDIWKRERRQGAEVVEHALGAYLTVLSCAHGPLTATELTELAHRAHGVEPGFRVESLLDPLRRLIVGSASHATHGYQLSHPRLVEFLRDEYVDRAAVLKTRQALMAWGRGVLDDLNSGLMAPDEAPSYLLNHLSRHFHDAEVPPVEFTKFLERGWLRAWEAFEGGWSGFLKDVQRTCVVAATRCRENEPRWGWQMRCRLIQSSIASVGGQLPVALLTACVECNLIPIDQALQWLRLAGDDAERLTALCDLASRIPASLHGEALLVIRTLESGDRRRDALLCLAPQLPDLLIGSAVDIARSIEDRDDCVCAMLGLCSRMPRDERAATVAWALAHLRLASSDRNRFFEAKIIQHLPDEAMDETFAITMEVADERKRAKLLGAVARRWPRELMRDCVVAVMGIVHGHDREDVLLEMAPHLSESDIMHVLAQPDAVDSAGMSRRRFIEAIAPRLSEPLAKLAWDYASAIDNTQTRAAAWCSLLHCDGETERASAIDHVLATIGTIEDARFRVPELLKVAPWLVGPERRALLQDVLTQIENVESRFDGTMIDGLWQNEHVFERLMPLLPPEMYAQALAVAGSIAAASCRLMALSAVVPRLCDPERSRVCRVMAATIRDEIGKGTTDFEILAASADAFPIQSRRDMLAELLGATASVADPWRRAGAVATLARHVPEDMLSACVFRLLDIRDGGRSIPPSKDYARFVAEHFCSGHFLGTLAKSLPKPLLSIGLAAIRAIGDESVRSVAGAGLCPGLLSDEQVTWMAEAIDVTNGVADEGVRGQVLVMIAAIAAHLDLNDVFTDVMSRISAIESISGRVHILSAMVSVSNERHRERMIREYVNWQKVDLTQAVWVWLPTWLKCVDEDKRDIALSLVIASVPEDIRKVARPIVKSVPASYFGAKLLTVLATANGVQPELLQEALSSALEISDAGSRLVVLAELFPHLSDERRGAAFFGMIDGLENGDGGSSREMDMLAELLPDEHVQRALLGLSRMKKEWQRSRGIVAFARRLPPSLIDDALDIAMAIDEPTDRCSALAALVPRLAEPVASWAIHNCLALLQTMSFERSIVEVIAQLLPNLPPKMRSEQFARAVAAVGRTTGYERVRCAIALLPFIPEADRERFLDEAAAAIELNRERVAGVDLERTRRLELLNDLLPHLTHWDQDRVARELLAAAIALNDPSKLADLLPSMPESLDEAVMTAFVDMAGNMNRWTLLELLPRFYPIVSRRDGPEGLRSIARAIRDTAAWFP